jgi:hypothetical protein
MVRNIAHQIKKQGVCEKKYKKRKKMLLLTGQSERANHHSKCKTLIKNTNRKGEEAE